MDPNDEDGHVDWKDQQHEHQDGMGVIVKADVEPGPLMIVIHISLQTHRLITRLKRDQKPTVSLASRKARVQVVI